MYVRQSYLIKYLVFRIGNNIIFLSMIHAGIGETHVNIDDNGNTVDKF